MRKYLVIALSAALAMALVTAPAQAGKKKKKKKKKPAVHQTVDGNIGVSTPFTDDSGCYAGLHRRQNAFTQGAANGIIGHDFAVDEKTWGENFVLEATGGEGYVDLDVYFYLGDLTTADDFVNQGGDPAPPPSYQINTRDAGGESGTVPEGTKHIIVCMYGGQFGVGANATYTYDAGTDVKLP